MKTNIKVLRPEINIPPETLAENVHMKGHPLRGDGGGGVVGGGLGPKKKKKMAQTTNVNVAKLCCTSNQLRFVTAPGRSPILPSCWVARSLSPIIDRRNVRMNLVNCVQFFTGRRVQPLSEGRL